MIRAFIYLSLSLLLAGFAALAGCTTPPAPARPSEHPGLAEDGYGFVKNGLRLPPPEHLMAKTPNRTEEPPLDAPQALPATGKVL